MLERDRGLLGVITATRIVHHGNWIELLPNMYATKPAKAESCLLDSINYHDFREFYN
jgi:hypothetical protein